MGLVYADEDAPAGDEGLRAPRFKPSYSPDFLLASGYIGRPMAMGWRVAQRLPGLVATSEADLDHECALAACEVADSIDHVAEVLCHRGTPFGAPGDRPSVDHVAAAVRRRGDSVQVHLDPRWGTYGLVRKPPADCPVSIVIPFRDEPRFLRTCVDSVTSTTTGLDVELLLVDNGSSDPEVLTLVERLATRADVSVLADRRPFNWAQLNNAAARSARGDVLVFLNNDIEAHREGWLAALVGHALRPDVGAVGARLLYPDRRVQHCGVVVGLIGAAGHPLVGLPEDQSGYLQMAVTTRECAAVTGACLATRREVFDQLAGFDETLGVDLNDVDYCLRAGLAGLRTIYEPAAELIHYESPSRGTAGGAEDIVNFIDRWKEYISAGDPYFSAHLTRTDTSCRLASPYEEERWKEWHEMLMTV
jgi:GT2 family glycosyltransferase